MPRYKTHLVGGLVSFLFLFPLVSSFYSTNYPEEVLFCLGMSLLGSLFPDIDIQSKMQNLFYTGITLVILYALIKDDWNAFFLASSCAILVALLRHRKITHRIWFLICFPIGVSLYMSHMPHLIPQLKSNTSPLMKTLPLFFIVGALSHVFLDRTVSKLRSLFK